MRKYEKYIVRKPLMIKEPKYHGKMTLPVFMGEEVVDEAKVTIHGHWINKKEKPKKKRARIQEGPLVQLHKHDVDKVYLCLGDSGASEMEVVLGNEKYKVKSPYAIYVPAGLSHAIISTKTIKPPVASAMILLKGKYN